MTIYFNWFHLLHYRGNSKGAKCQIVQLRPLSGAESEGNGILEDHDKTTPNLLDMIPPPPHYPPPRCEHEDEM